MVQHCKYRASDKELQCGCHVRTTQYGPNHLQPFDLETGIRVTSKVGNLRSKFGHARPLGPGIIRYARN